MHERIRRPIAALAVVWVLVGALAGGAATLVADGGILGMGGPDGELLAAHLQGRYKLVGD